MSKTTRRAFVAGSAAISSFFIGGRAHAAEEHVGQHDEADEAHAPVVFDRAARGLRDQLTDGLLPLGGRWSAGHREQLTAALGVQGTVEGERRSNSLRGGTAGRGWLHYSATHANIDDFLKVVLPERLGGAGLDEADAEALSTYIAYGIPTIQGPAVDADLRRRDAEPVSPARTFKTGRGRLA